ncbi:uncharacterized protein LOC143854899 [Tasmannia lanceolata]|uniref:uncharacterized protein LOC143854899 n=1 Tax=Tasmannia lanceolata TaxID=3420 RepID=UPI004063BB54
MTRALMFQIRVPKVYWGDVALTSYFLANSLSSSVLANKSPFSVFHPFGVPFSFLPCVFSCVFFVQNLSPGLDKLDPRAEKCFLLGYSHTQKDYKWYGPRLRKLFVSADVTFFESTSFFSSSADGVVADTRLPLPIPPVSMDTTPLQLDVKNAFLHGDREDEVYIEQPPGYVAQGENWLSTCRLRKAIYGLKQSPRAWFERFNEVVIRFGMRQCVVDHSVFSSWSANGCIFLIVYVDDIAITGSDRKVKLAEVPMDPNVKLYPEQEDLLEGPITQIVRYLKKASGKGLFFKQHGHLNLEGFTNADWAGSPADKRSTTGYCTFVEGNLVSWRSKKQDVVARSSVTTGVGSILLVCILFSLFCRRKLSVYNLIFFCKKKTNNTKKVDVFLRDYGSSLGPRRYIYSDIKKITSSFKDKVGQGGYGSVFKGKLRDGCLVAVKVLSESKGNGEEFINEVASISRTSHVNVVSLLGFCSQGLKRALIYEFMPNGSLDKFIYAEKPRKADPLGWEKLYQITVGIAQGLEYLHRGCNTRILHLDIKPHNILLDQDFCPKISDFGLAKLCPTKDSTISLVGARGTFGYTAPEIGCRNIGGVSTKSDVYSYGMMVLEIVGGRKNIDAGVDNTSEIYFPHLIYKRMDLNGDLGLDGVTAEEEKIARKMILVSLWCIQTNPTNRPSMNMVVEMLEGSLEDLQMPPNPILLSPNPTNQPSMNMVVEMLEGSLEDLQMPPNPILSSPTRLSQEAATMSMIVRDGSPYMSHGSSQLGEIALIHSSLH